jgi:hypothetical protein
VPGVLTQYKPDVQRRYTPERLRELTDWVGDQNTEQRNEAEARRKSSEANKRKRLLERTQQHAPSFPNIPSVPLFPSITLPSINLPTPQEVLEQQESLNSGGPVTEPPQSRMSTLLQNIPRRELFNPEGELREDATAEELNRSMSELQELVNGLSANQGRVDVGGSTYPGIITNAREKMDAIGSRLADVQNPFASQGGDPAPTRAAPTTTGQQGAVGDTGAGGAGGAGEPLVSALTTLRTAVENSNASESTAVLTQALAENKEALAGFSQAVQNISQSVEHSVDGALDIDLGIGNLGGIIEAAMGPVKAAIVEQVKASVLQQINGLRVDLGLTGN